jgi:uncharacterized damage-inducible protein DinB
MIKRQKWIDHTFTFGQDLGWSQNLIARLSGSIIRIEHYAKSLSDDQCSRRYNDRWSIKDHVGHLIDLESLFIKRLEELDNLSFEFSPADMSNTTTEKAQYRNWSIEKLIGAFKTERDVFIQTFTQLSDEGKVHKAYHKRLDTWLNPTDVLLFSAEHDDHHIASILEIKEIIGQEKESV